MREQKKIMRPRVISLFTGAGGLDYGLEAAGFETAVAVEWDADACKTLRKNRPKWAVIEDSIFDVKTKRMLEEGCLAAGEVDLVSGGPPCQPFSKAGNWAREHGLPPGLEDTRADTLGAFMRVVQEARPRVVLLENVEGFAHGVDSGLAFILKKFATMNKKLGTRYAPATMLLDAAAFGVPQARKRRFVVAHRDGTLFNAPKATHGVGEGLLPFTTAWDALGDETPDEGDLHLRGTWADLLPSVPEGENYTWHTAHGGGEELFGWRRRYWTFLLKLAKTRPSWTIQAHPGPSAGPFHWKNRKLAISELCRLQTFPEGIEIIGARGAAHRQVGNAVPSLLAEVLGRELLQQFFKETPTKALHLIPNRRLPVPEAEPVASFPKKYLPLVGPKEEHPGPGLGPGAKARAKKTKTKTNKTKKATQNQRAKKNNIRKRAA